MECVAALAAMLALDLNNNGATKPSWSPLLPSMELEYQLFLQLPCLGLHSLEVIRPEGTFCIELAGLDLGSMMPTPTEIRNFMDKVCVEIGFQAEEAAEGPLMVRLSHSTPILLAFMLASYKHDLKDGVVEHTTGLEPATETIAWEFDGRVVVDQSRLITAWKSLSLESWGIEDGHVFTYRPLNGAGNGVAPAAN